MRRFLIGSLSCFMVLAAVWLPIPSALAQPAPQPAATLTLVSQSAWNSVSRPLDVVVQATNTAAAPLDSLSIVLSIWSPARSRSAYELSLHGDTTSNIFTFPFVQQGTLQPGQSRAFRLRQSLSTVPLLTDSALFPLKLTLFSHDVPLAVLRTPMIFLIERPQVPLNLTSTWVLSAPVEYGPDGKFLPGSLEKDIALGGRLAAMAQSLTLTAPAAVDMVISPVLVGELTRMAAGYSLEEAGGGVRTVPPGTGGAADAARLLATLKSVATRPSTETVGMPFSDPSLPALARSGLISDLTALQERSRDVIESALGATPSTTVVRPPLSQLDPASLSKLVSLGAQTVLIDPNFVPTQPGLPLSASPVIRLAAGQASAAALAPDMGVAAMAASGQADPQLAAHATLGELAAIWLELPGTLDRGAAVLFSERTSYPTSFLTTFAGLIRSSPWLRPVTASRMATIVTQPARVVLPLHGYPALDPAYVGQLLAARASLAQFRHSAQGAETLVGQLENDLFLSEGSTFLSSPRLGLGFIQAVSRAVRDTYSRVKITTSLVTLTSRSGVIPVTVSNRSRYAINARLRLVADRRLGFVDGSDRPVVLSRGSAVFTFRVRAQTTGRFPIKVQVETSDGPDGQTISETDMVVRSTAYNRVALFLTIGAAVFLMGWWGRRLLPRKRS